jgi:hypothetical protein
MPDSKTKTWAEGLRFIRSKILSSEFRLQGKPYEAMFGTVQRIGHVDSPLIEDIYSSIETAQVL